METNATDTCSNHEPVKSHDPLKIKGYRTLSEGEIDLMNKVKELGVGIEAVTKLVAEHIDSQLAAQDGMSEEDAVAEVQRLQQADPILWLQNGTLKMQEGLMCLTRAVAQPTFF